MRLRSCHACGNRWSSRHRPTVIWMASAMRRSTARLAWPERRALTAAGIKPRRGVSAVAGVVYGYRSQHWSGGVVYALMSVCLLCGSGPEFPTRRVWRLLACGAEAETTPGITFPIRAYEDESRNPDTCVAGRASCRLDRVPRRRATSLSTSQSSVPYRHARRRSHLANEQRQQAGYARRHRSASSATVPQGASACLQLRG